MFDKPGSAQSSEVGCDRNGTSLGGGELNQNSYRLILNIGVI